ncbi:MAG: hypothetical protein HY682_08025 [Chloroflexi bacterium]|nr:hypothetical protein [Chloroflexota bacterium]
MDAVGNLLVADLGNRRIRLIDLITRTISTLAGDGKDSYAGDGGPATKASLGEPSGIALARNGDIYVADRAHGVVRKIDGTTAVVSTVAGASEKLNAPWDVAFDGDERLLVAEPAANRVRRLDMKSGTISTLEVRTGNDGATSGGPLKSPCSIACDAEGNVYVCEKPAHRVRRVRPTGEIEAFAGSGVPGYTGDGRGASAATLREPECVYVDGHGNVLIADTGNHAIRFVEHGTGVIYTVAGGRRGFKGDGRDAAAAALDSPTGCAIDPDGYIYIADSNNNRIRAVESAATEDDGYSDDEMLSEDARLAGRRGRGGGLEEE